MNPLALDGTGATAAPEGLGRMMRKGLLGGLVAALPGAAGLVSAPSASATPVCAGLEHLAAPPCPRVFPEPAQSTNWTQFGPDSLGRSEFADGMKELTNLYPNYIKFEKLSDLLHDPMAVSIGADGLPPWDPKDAGDGLPIYVNEVSDFRVPDDNKAYVVITEVHSAEPCGREAAIRTPEDLAIWASDGVTTIDNGAGPDGKRTTIRVADLLKREHVFFLWNSPDGWRSGDQDLPHWLTEQSSDSRPRAQSQYGDIRFTYSEENGRGVNTNRQAPSTGWMFRQPPDTYPANSPRQNPILTEPEGIATWRYLTGLKHKHGHIDGVMDIHGPLPFPADIMLPDGQFNPHKEQLLLDMAQRVKEKMDQSVGQHVQDPGLYDQLRGLPGSARLGSGPTDLTKLVQVCDAIHDTPPLPT